LRKGQEKRKGLETAGYREIIGKRQRRCGTEGVFEFDAFAKHLFSQMRTRQLLLAFNNIGVQQS
jgi:hypothetical protein